MIRMRPIALGPRGDVIERRSDGAILLRSPEPLAPHCRSATERLAYWARAAPERVFLGQRDASGAWRRVTYSEAIATVERLAQSLVDCGLSLERPLMVLSGNDIEHALIGLAAMHVGIPYVPVSVPFSLASKDHEKLRHVASLIRPGLIFAASGRQFAAAIAAIGAAPELVVTREPLAGARLFEQLAATAATEAVARAAAAVDVDTVAKVLFTSGSTAMPKGVINTHRMLSANQQMATQAWPFLRETPPVVVDWLPWNHTFGGNFVFGNTLFHGGAYYIDDGRPVGDEILNTVRNLKEIRPTVYFSVPKTYEALLPHLESDQELATAFFSRLQMLFYAAAVLPQSAWDRLQRLAVETVGERIFMTSTLGSTETAPLAITANWDVERPGIIGLPVPGVEVKLVPTGSKLEFRVRGPNVTPGYWRQPEKTAQAFDAEGFYSLGDAVRFADPADPGEGLIFDGRLAEDFKLATGVWVSVGALREKVSNLFFPLVRDFVICGHDRDEVGVLLFPDFEACRALGRLPPDASYAAIVERPEVREAFRQRLIAAAATGTSSSNRIVRALLMTEYPHAVETTDKGTLAYNLIVERRAAEIERLYASTPSPHALLAK
jgi:feruloyl-CoA synthase